ncbi:MAG TPA: TIGR03016 family PEP-CTERM system-associated outer membrane protein [Casimicrobiaceae bacterium]|nr:TIGR03016 family PEP-CTERM system-associated outer membrane protein [Casimicrobiaceae bacterium]
MGRALTHALAAGALAAMTAGVASAQAGYGNLPVPVGGPRAAATNAPGWHIVPQLDSELDFTDNVDLAPSGARRSDFVLELTPGLLIHEKSAHSSLAGTISAPILLYARTGGENNNVRPEVSLVGNAELVERLFYVDASAHVSQQYLSPFGAHPQNLTNATSNRYTAQSYRVSPYLKGDGANDIHYELRDNNTWSNASDVSAATSSAYTNQILGNVTRDPRPLGWALDFDRTDTRFSSQNALRSQLERARALWLPDPQLELSASAGYEDNDYGLFGSSGVIYGAGFKWRPTSRSNMDATWEHRFFGSSYHVLVDHRTPLSVWSFLASRDITTYPQQLASLAAGVDVDALLNGLFASRVADPTQRQTLIDQLIRDRGLPTALSGPLALFSEQVTLQETLQTTAGLLGARNSIFVTAYRTRTEPVTGQAAASAIDLLALQNDNTQTGTNVVWSYKLTPLYTLATSGDWSRSVPNADTGLRSTQITFRIVLSAPLSPLTTVYTGARHQRLISDVQQSYRETAVYVGIRHAFY